MKYCMKTCYIYGLFISIFERKDMVKIKENSECIISSTHKKQMNDDFLIESISIFEGKVMVKIKEIKFIISGTVKNR